MPGYTRLDAATLRRDLSLALRRRLVVCAALAATSLTAIFALVAATTNPGHAAAPAAANPAIPPASQGTAPVITQPSIVPPVQLPQSGASGSPVTISGGS